MPPGPAPRNLRPAVRGYSPLPVVGVGSQLKEMAAALAAPCVIVATNPLSVLEAAERALGAEPGWRWACSDGSDVAGTPESGNRWAQSRSLISVQRFGFPQRWWRVVSPAAFFSGLSDRRWTATALQQWGEDLDGWCKSLDLPLPTTRGGLGARLLRDARWFPMPRRIVPAAVNEQGRDHLPGNFYAQVAARAARAVYYDQRSAHHFHAWHERLPDPDDLHAQGGHRDSDAAPGWCTPGSRTGKRILGAHGLLAVDLECPGVEPGDFAPPWFLTGRQWIFTNELEALERLGGRLVSIVAAWTSPDPWAGISSFAQWAMNAISEAPASRRAWLKPSLLSAYGVLACRPRAATIHSHGRGALVHLSNGMTGYQNPKPRQAPVAHTIALGMIQAATRRESLAMARQLGPATMGIYSDAVIARAGSDPAPTDLWKKKSELTNFAYLGDRATWYESDQETKMPGMSQGTR